MQEKVACITGATGQVGSYLSELLLEKGYTVIGMKRRSSSLNTDRVNHIFNNPNFKLIYGDICDYASVSSFISEYKPELFFNTAAQSHVAVSFQLPIYTQEATGNSVLNCLEAIKTHSPDTRFITMSSSEMYGKTPAPQNENTKFQPQSPYAVAKLMGYYNVQNYRDAYGMFCCNAICFNTESPRRGETFFPRKLTRAASRIKLGLQKELRVGNLKSKRAFLHAKDTCEALYKIITADKPDDFVVSSDTTNTMQYLTELVFAKLRLNWKDYVVIDQTYFRPLEVDELLGDASKIKNILGWKANYDLNMLVDEMIECDLELARKEKLILDNQ